MSLFTILQEPSISSGTLDHLLEQYQVGLRAAGIGPRSEIYLELLRAGWSGRRDETRRRLRRWQNCPRTPLCGPQSWDIPLLLEVYAHQQEDERILRLVDRHDLMTTLPVEFPGAASLLLLPLWRAGRVEEAARLHEAHRARVLGSLDHLAAAGRHLHYLSHLDDLDPALELLRHPLWRVCAVRPSTGHLWNVLLGAGHLFERLVQQGDPTVELTHPLTAQHGRFPARVLLQDFRQRSRLLAARFDDRNGNDARRRRVP